MIRLTYLLFVSGLVCAQTLTITGPATAKAGDTVPLAVAINGGTPAAIQWSVTLPAGLKLATPTAGASSTAASKQVACNAQNSLCIVYGMNQNGLANGVVANAQLTIPVSTVAGAKPIPLSGLLGVAASGSALKVVSGAPYSITVISAPVLGDINGDGVVTIADVNLIVGQVMAGTCANDQDASGTCDIFDVAMVVLRALGK